GSRCLRGDLGPTGLVARHVERGRGQLVRRDAEGVRQAHGVVQRRTAPALLPLLDRLVGDAGARRQLWTAEPELRSPLTKQAGDLVGLVHRRVPRGRRGGVRPYAYGWE